MTLANRLLNFLLALTLMLALGVTSLTSTTLNASAATLGDNPQDEGMFFSISALRAESQREPFVGYFDVLVKPDSVHTLELEVTNSSSIERTFLVGAKNASTTPSGTLNYDTDADAVLDESLKTPFTAMAKVVDEIKIPGNSSEIVKIKINLPKEPFKGLVLGSVRVLDITSRLARESAEADATPDGEMSVAIYNEYQAILAIRVTEDEKTPIDPHFEMGDVTTGFVNSRIGVIASIRNPQPLLIKGAKFSGEVKEKNSKDFVFKIEDKDVELAPSSAMNYEFTDSEGYGIKAGSYTFVGSITYEGETWEFAKDFTVDQEKAQELEAGAVNLQGGGAARGGIPTWAIIAIGVGVLVILLLVVIIIKMRRNA